MRVHVGPSCGGGVSTLRVGVRHRPASAEGLRRALIPTRVKRIGVITCTAAYSHRERTVCTSTLLRRTRTPRYHTRSLLGSHS